MSQERLQGHLSSEGFRANIQKLSAYTVRHGMEGGIAAYSDGTCQVDLPNVRKTRQQADAHIVSSKEAMESGHVNYDPTKLTSRALSDREIILAFETDPDADLSPLQRSDIDLFLHSHPIHQKKPTVAAAREMLAPSNPDLDHWERMDLEAPGVTGGVLVPTKQSTELILWRHDPADRLNTYYQQLESHDPAARVVRVMRESGIRVATMDMTLEGQAYTDQVEGTVEQLYP